MVQKHFCREPLSYQIAFDKKKQQIGPVFFPNLCGLTGGLGKVHEVISKIVHLYFITTERVGKKVAKA